jgi:hypothetical protein
MQDNPSFKAWRLILMIPVLGFLDACTTVTYPNGTTVTTPYVAPAVYAPIYGTPGYPVPVAPYAPPGTPGAYYGYGCGYASIYGVGWRQWVNNWSNWGCYNRGWSGGYGGYRPYNGYRPACGYPVIRRGY